MGREVRRVPATWEHPKNDKGHDIPLYDGYFEAVREWDEEAAQWKKGFRHKYTIDGPKQWVPKDADNTGSYAEWAGERPDWREYMPDFPAQDRTHYQMYEVCSEGTPISPVMDMPENLARWLTDNEASAFGSMTATYEQWLETIMAGSSVSGVFTPETGLISGVLRQ